MGTSFEEARSLILGHVTMLEAEQIPLLDATGRILAEDIRAPWDMPLWDNSAMDGFAVQSRDCEPGARLSVTGYIAAGDVADGKMVAPGSAVKIMTGAPAPEGCDAILPIEQTEEVGAEVVVREGVEPGAHLRLRGEDVSKDEEIIKRGAVLRPAEISQLASFGKLSVSVYRKPRIAVLSTGDELVEPGQPLGPGQIVDSNSMAMAGAIKELGAEPIMLGIARDDPDSLREKLAQSLAADALITSAGISLGDRDFVLNVLSDVGVEMIFVKVEVKPGRPTAFGLHNGKPVFSLPGNPVSSMLTFEEFVRPAILQMMGHPTPIKPFVKVMFQGSRKKKPGQVQLLRVCVTRDGDDLVAVTAGDQNTGILKTMLSANGVAVLPPDREGLQTGDLIDVHLLDTTVV